MAAVHAPRHAQHPHSISSSSASSNHSPFRRVHRATYAPPPAGKSSSASAAAAASTSIPSSTAHRTHHTHHPQPAPPPCVETYYGHEDTSKLCARFVSHTFNCPEMLPPPASSTAVSRSSTGSGSSQHPPIPNTLAHFVAYALHRTRLHPSVVFTALALLHRLKARFPAARGSSGHRLFLAAYMLASKVVCDDTYSNKSWAVVGQGMFALREINQMEREMLGYLEWSLNVPGEDLAKFEQEVKRIYGNPNGRDGSGRDGWGRGVEMRLTAGVGGHRPEDDLVEVQTVLHPIVPTVANAEKSPKLPHQLPTPTDSGPAAIPISRPILPQITTNMQKMPAYPSPPTSPPPASAPVNLAVCDSDCSSASTSPVDGNSDRDESDSEDEALPAFHPRSAHPRLTPDHGQDGSPSPASSEDSATLPTPPNSALSASGTHHRVHRGYAPGYGQKMVKSHTVPGFAYTTRETGRSSAPPVAIPVVKRGRDAVVSSVSASHFGSFAPVASVEEDGDAVMELEDEKRGGVAYYATVHPVSVPRPASATVPSRAPPAVAVRKDGREREREIREGRRDREGRSLRTFTVPCAW